MGRDWRQSDAGKGGDVEFSIADDVLVVWGAAR
jgi:hypothetical protein